MKARENHENSPPISRLSRPFAGFVIQTPLAQIAQVWQNGLDAQDALSYTVGRAEKMISAQPGTATLQSEVTDIIATGFWLLVDDQEYFVPFEDYPVFLEATVAQIYAVQRLSPTQFHWPELDADIELEALEQPERFPLAFR